MFEVPDFYDPNSPRDLRVHRVTEDPKGASAVYPDRPSFLADGRRFIVQTSTGPAICDLDAGAALYPVFTEDAPRSILCSPDGRYGYFTASGQEDSGSLTVSRVDLETRHIEVVFHAEDRLPGADLPAKDFRMSTVSVDNRRVAGMVTIGDGQSADSQRCVVMLDLDSGQANRVVANHDFNNPHLQYCRSTDPEASHDLLIQMNHGAYLDERTGQFIGLGPPADKGVDVHAVRDDGSNWRDLPFGRDGLESCIGHQIWRGQDRSVVTVTLQNLDTSYGWAEGSAQEAIAGWPVPADKDSPHLGRLHPGARRVDLSQGFTRPRFCHLACDAAGLRFAFDTFPIFDGERAGMQLIVGSAADLESPLRFTYLLNTQVTFNKSKGYHAHPILSPDGSILLFNSNLTGIPQVYLVTGFAW